MSTIIRVVRAHPENNDTLVNTMIKTIVSWNNRFIKKLLGLGLSDTKHKPYLS